MEDKYINVNDLGMVVRDRLKKGVSMSCIHFDDKDNSYTLSKRAMNDFENFFLWLSGSSNYLKSNRIPSRQEQEIWED
jgi:hypothetical protein